MKCPYCGGQLRLTTHKMVTEIWSVDPETGDLAWDDDDETDEGSELECKAGCTLTWAYRIKDDRVAWAGWEKLQ